MHLIAYLIVFWLANAGLSYLAIRSDIIGSTSDWTRADRLVAILVSLLLGPFVLVSIVVTSLFTKLFDSKWGRTNARW